MKGLSFAGPPRIHRYQPGDLLLETERLAAATPPVLHVLGGQPAPTDQQKADSFLDSLKPKPDDYPALKSALQFFKFSPDDAIAYHEAIGMTINLAASVVSVVGTVITVVNLLNEVFGKKKEDESLQYLQHISQRVDQIYGYLAGKERRGLYDETVTWRGTMKNVRTAVSNARGSRSPINLKALVDLKPGLDGNLDKMLDPNKGTIAFLRATYGYTGDGHWIDAAVSPWVNLADGTTVNYRDPAQELQGTIWDAGHYVDMLLGSLMDRLLLVTVTEPAFRSTNYDRPALESMLSGLTAFLHKWRASLIVADPLVGLNGGGHLQHPAWSAPIGIPIGAVDPVTGISFFESYWQDFVRVDTWEGSIAAKGSPDYTTAKDPNAALARALDTQPRLLDATIKASGITRFIEFRARLQDLLARYTTGSDFVHLPNASFHLLQMTGPAPQPEMVDLGFIGHYTSHPDEKYEGRRYTQSLEKRFRFAMALRADVSLIQLGYRMEIGDRNIPLIPYSVAPGDGSPASRFPTTPISVEIRAQDWEVFDVVQSSLFSQAEEDRFEGIEPPAVSPWLQRITAFPAERIFLNGHEGPVALEVEIAFETDLDSPDQPFAGHASVTIRNLDPETCRGGIILPVRVYETRCIGAANETEEVLADIMTIHVVPSFLVVGRQYFEDRREGKARMDQIFGDINEKYAISVQPGVRVGPEWEVRRRAMEEVATHQAIQRFVEAEPNAGQAALGRVLPPHPMRRG